MGKNIVLIDGFWGDGGKGNVASVILDEIRGRLGSRELTVNKPLLVYSPVGGRNAANTFHIDGRTITMRQVPGGVLVPEIAFSQAGVEKYVRPRELVKEIAALREMGYEISPQTYGIAPNAHVTLDHHIEADRNDAIRRGGSEHATTGNGNRQTGEAKYARRGIRLIEFLDEDLMKEALKREFGDDAQGAARLAGSYAEERELIAPFLLQDRHAFRRHGAEFKLVVNAHGVGLDIDHGNYPGITSSRPASVPHWADTIVGVFKMYASSVGVRDRAFVARMDPELESRVREEWGEVGSGTGHPRQLGYFDTVQGRYSIDVTGMQGVAITCGDRMEAFYSAGVKPKIVVAYKIDGRTYEGWEDSFLRRDTLHTATPVSEEFEPWERFTEEDGQTLTPKAQIYVNRLQERLGIPIAILMNGGEGSKDAIVYQSPLDL